MFRRRPTFRKFLCRFIFIAFILTLTVSGQAQNLMWAKRAGGSDPDRSRGIAVLWDGSARIVGYFGGTATFGPGESGETTLTSAGSEDIFIARYNWDGTLAWAKRAGGSGIDQGSGIAVLSDWSVLVTGDFSSTATFGPGEITSTTLTSAGDRDIFVARYNWDGTLAWAKRAGGSDVDYGVGVAVLSDNGALVTGEFSGTATFGLGEITSATLISAGSQDIFIARYNPDGTLVWAKRAGGSDVDHGVGVAVLSDNSALVTGEFSGTATFGLGEITSATLNSAGNRDIFVARYDSNGTLIWAKRAGGSGLDRGSDIAVPVLFDGSARVTGEFSGTATFGPGEITSTTLTSAGGEDIFIARYNSDGTLAWAKRAGGTGQDSGLEIAMFFDWNAAVTGFFSGSATFGPGESGETLLTSAGDRDIFVARYGSNGTLAWAKRAGGSGLDLGRGMPVPSLSYSVLVSGGFTGTATFGSGESGETTLTSAGDLDIFVALFAGPVPGVNDWEEYGISEP